MRLTRLLQPLALATVLAASIGSAGAQTFSLNWNPRSGDAWVDTQLADMNRYGTQYRDPFIDEMVRYHGAQRDHAPEPEPELDALEPEPPAPEPPPARR